MCSCGVLTLLLCAITKRKGDIYRKWNNRGAPNPTTVVTEDLQRWNKEPVCVSACILLFVFSLVAGFTWNWLTCDLPKCSLRATSLNLLTKSSRSLTTFLLYVAFFWCRNCRFSLWWNQPHVISSHDLRRLNATCVRAHLACPHSTPTHFRFYKWKKKKRKKKKVNQGNYRFLVRIYFLFLISQRGD